MTKKEIIQKEKERKKFLADVKRVFEKKYGEPLSDERVEAIAKRLMMFTALCHNIYSKQQGKEPMYQL